MSCADINPRRALHIDHLGNHRVPFSTYTNYFQLINHTPALHTSLLYSHYYFSYLYRLQTDQTLHIYQSIYLFLSNSIPMIPLHCHVYWRNPYIAPLFTLFQLSFFQNSFHHIDVICEVTAQVLFILSLRPFLVYCFSCPLFLPCTIRLSKHFYRITC